MSVSEKGKKRKRENEEINDDEVHLSKEEEEEILKLVDQAPEVKPLDLTQLKKMVLQFEKKITKNQQMRVKFPDNPNKFMESEVELDEEIKNLHLLATNPELYPEFVKTNALQSLLNLLTHENNDIAIDVVNVIQELTDSDALAESEATKTLVTALIANQALELLVQNLSRLDEKQSEDVQAVFNTLSIIENLAEFEPQMVETITEKTDIMKYLLQHISKDKPFDGNKLYSSEILSILLQTVEKNQKKLAELDGIEILLQSISAYRKKDPETVEESEMLENLFDCLCSAFIIISVLVNIVLINFILLFSIHNKQREEI